MNEHKKYFNDARKGRGRIKMKNVIKRKLVSVLLCAAMMMGTIAGTATVTNAVEETLERNIHGQLFDELVEKSQDNPAMLALLAELEAEYGHVFYGESPYLATEPQITVAEEELSVPAYVPLRPLSILPTSGFVGISPMSSDPVSFCLRWYFQLAGSSPNQTATLTGRTLPESTELVFPKTIQHVVNFVTQTLPVTQIGDGFTSSGNYIRVRIADSITRVGNSAFANKPSLTRVSFDRATPPTFGTNVFQGSNNINTIRVPFGSITSYRAVSQLSSHNIIGYCSFDHLLNNETCNCKFRLGDVNGDGTINNNMNPTPPISDAHEILLYVGGNPSWIKSANGVYNPNALQASLITSVSKANGKPRSADATEILKYIVQLPGDLFFHYGYYQ